MIFGVSEPDLEDITVMAGKPVLKYESAMAEKTVTIPQGKKLTIHKKGKKRSSQDISTARPVKRRKDIVTEENRRVTRSMTKARLK